jgi:hypothetical protein
MKSLFLSMIFLTAPLSVFANGMEMTYECGSPQTGSHLDAGPEGQILQIKALHILSQQQNNSFKVAMDVRGVTTLDAANGNSRPQDSTETYGMKESKTGTLVELLPSTQNKFSFDAVFLEFGSLNSDSAGPVAPGKYNLKISMGFVDSNIYYKNPSPMTVQKVVFDCTSVVKY